MDGNNGNHHRTEDKTSIVDDKENSKPVSCKYKTVRPPNVPITRSSDYSSTLSPFGAPESAGTYEVIPHRIFVGGFNAETTEEELRECFKDCGQIREVKVVRCNETNIGKGYGFITFESDDEARAVRTSNERFELKGRRLNLGPAMRRIYQQKPANPPFSPAATAQQGAAIPMPLYSYPIPMMPMFYQGPNGQFFGSQFVSPASNFAPIQPQIGNAINANSENVRKRSSMLSSGCYGQQPQATSLTPSIRSHTAGAFGGSVPSAYNKGQSRFGNRGDVAFAPFNQLYSEDWSTNNIQTGFEQLDGGDTTSSYYNWTSNQG